MANPSLHEIDEQSIGMLLIVGFIGLTVVATVFPLLPFLMH
jgi:hypothetical protein